MKDSTGAALMARRLLTLAADHPAAGDHIARRGPAIALECTDQVAHRAGILGGAARPDKAGFNAAVINGEGGHDGFWLDLGLATTVNAKAMPSAGHRPQAPSFERWGAVSGG